MECAGSGVAVSSSNKAYGLTLDGLSTHEASAAVIRWLQEKQLGAAQTNYKLRDWLFARQRYWGEPFPIVFEEGSEVSVISSKSFSNPVCPGYCLGDAPTLQRAAGALLSCT